MVFIDEFICVWLHGQCIGNSDQYSIFQSVISSCCIRYSGITMIQCPLKREKTWWRQLQAEILWKSAFKHLNPLDWNIDPVRHSYPGFRHTFNHLFAYNYSCLPVFQWKGNYVAQQLCMAVAVYSVHVMINSSHIPANTISSSNIWNRINDSVCSTHWNRLYKDIDRPKIITFEGKNKKCLQVKCFPSPYRVMAYSRKPCTLVLMSLMSLFLWEVEYEWFFCMHGI